MADVTDITGEKLDDGLLRELEQWNILLERYAGRRLQPRDTVSSTFLIILRGMNQHIEELERNYAALLKRLSDFNNGHGQ